MSFDVIWLHTVFQLLSVCFLSIWCKYIAHFDAGWTRRSRWAMHIIAAITAATSAEIPPVDINIYPMPCLAVLNGDAKDCSMAFEWIGDGALVWAMLRHSAALLLFCYFFSHYNFAPAFLLHHRTHITHMHIAHCTMATASVCVCTTSCRMHCASI